MTTYYRGVEVSADVKSNKSSKASDLNYRGTNTLKTLSKSRLKRLTVFTVVLNDCCIT